MSTSAEPDADKLRAGVRAWRDHYIPIVDHYCPFASEPQRELRCSLLQLRDVAASRMRYCPAEAYEILSEIVGVVSEYVFSPMPADDLKSLRATAARMLLAAMGPDHVTNAKPDPRNESD